MLHCCTAASRGRVASVCPSAHLSVCLSIRGTRCPDALRRWAAGLESPGGEGGRGRELGSWVTGTPAL